MAAELAYDDELGPWQDDAACKGEPLNAFYPDDPRRVPPEVLALCSICPVRSECLDHALAHEAFGVWAGTSPEQRQRLRGVRGTRLERPEVDKGATTRRVVELYRIGVEVPDIAAQTDISVRSVYRLLATAGVEVSPPDDWRRQPRAAAPSEEDEWL